MSIFGKKKENVQVIDLVFTKQEAKWHASVEVARTQPSAIFIAWFDETLQQVQTYFTEHNVMDATLILYRQASAHLTSNNPVIFVEHYPLRGKRRCTICLAQFKGNKSFFCS